ncbi:MAG TPA: anthranilate synthase component I [Verrucomicrobiae bacterium]|jgi:anthranilate synthase component 1|nr:anthranilate synthase component I [Verrucomicrobiae bacterium]
MISPDLKTFSRLARKGGWVAVTGTILADLETPVSSFLKVAHGLPNAFLLESAEQAEHIGRYSILGVSPPVVLTQDSRGKAFRFEGSKKKPLPAGVELTEVMAREIREFRLANPEELSGFSGGWVGFLAYENVERFEDIRLNRLPGPDMPQGVFFLCRDFLVFDHFRKQLKIVVMAPTRGKGAAGQYRKAVAKIRAIAAQLQKPLKIKPSRGAKKWSVKTNMTQAQFEAKVKRAKEYIRAGDCIQIVLSQRFTLPGVPDDFQVYRALRSINPSPYMFYFRCGDLRLVGTSPELLVKKTGTVAEVRPIAGTRPRGATPEEDLRHEDNLKRSSKELAEHLMLVDLGRNDLGRVCQYDSIRVQNFARIERYSHVMHLVSDVTGKLKKGKTAFDLLKATFPAGTVSGAPKIRAMQIINELEPEKRGPYAGCLGYFGFNQDMDMCITIRTLMVYKNKIYLQAGAGIVKDSIPSREYQETVNKARALMKALQEHGDI